MERKKNSAYGHPKIKTIKTAKTIATSLPTYHCHPERSAAESKDLVEVTATRRGSPRPLNYSTLPSNYSQLPSTALNFFPYKTVRDHHNGLNGHNGLNKTNSIHRACPSSG